MSSHVALLLVLVATLPASAQTTRRPASRAPASDQKLIAVHVTGSQRYTAEEITAACGFHIGDTVGEDDFNRATRDLGESGLFSDVSYTYARSGEGTKLEVKLVDNDRLVPAQFENIVWFSDDQLLSELRRRVPLFQGKLPLGGNLADQVSDALQAMLLENHVPGHANYTVGPDNAPIEYVSFSVDNATLLIRQVEISGAAASELPALQGKAQKLADKEYSRTRLDEFATRELLPIYQARGYLKATFGEPKVKVHEQREDETILDVTLPVDPGRAYNFDKVEWSGNQAFTAAKLQPLIHLETGHPANAVQLKSDLQDVQKLYATRGYVRATVTPEASFDDAQGTVAYGLKVEEGDVYHMGELDIRGLDSKTTAQLRDRWTMREGDPYDAGYSKRFLEVGWKLLANQVDWTVDVHEAVDDKEKTVDVSLVYGVRASR